MGADFQRTYSLTYLVDSGNVLDAARAVLNCKDLPRFGDRFVRDRGAYAPSELTGEVDRDIWLVKKTAKPHENDPRLWLVTAEWDSTPPDPLLQANNPLDMPAVIKPPGIERVQEVTSFDINGQPIVNSAGDPIEGVTVDGIVVVWEITKNLGFLDVQTLDAWIDVVNFDQWNQAEPHQLKIHDIRYGERGLKNGTNFYPVTFIIHKKPLDEGNSQPWQAKLLDAGFRWFNPFTAMYQNIVDNYGHNVSSPGLLDGEGVEKARDAPPVFLTYRIRRVKPFADLPIQPPFQL